MVTNKLEQYVWKSKENIRVKQNAVIEYKYVVFKNGKFSYWEDLPNNSNRIIKISNLLRIIINDSKGMVYGKIETYTKGFNSVDIFNATDDYFNLDIRERSKKVVYCENNIDTMIQESYNENEICEIDKYRDLDYRSDEESISLIPKKKQLQEVKDTDRILMVCAFLPCKVQKNPETNLYEIIDSPNPFQHNLLNLTKDKKNIIWIGFLQNFYQIPEEDREIVVSLLKKSNLIAVKIPLNVFQNFQEFILNILEPMFHYMTVFHDLKVIRLYDKLWKAYREFNDLISRAVCTILAENCLIWVHDYHLLLTPSFIYTSYHNFYYKSIKSISIGLFFHSPFPSNDLFKRFPNREEILKAMINCSIIGFHTFDASRNFLMNCKRVLQIHYNLNISGDLCLSYLGRNVMIRVKHVLSEPTIIEKEILKDEFKVFYNQIKEEHKDKYIFVSIDHLLFLSGIRHKLEGYRRFLRSIGDKAKENVLIQYLCEEELLIRKDESIVLNELRQEITTLVKSIKVEFGESSIVLIQKNISYCERLALLAAGNCFIKTSKRERFSIDIFEFLNLKSMLNQTKDITYILSEVSGLTSTLAGAIKVNPFDFHSIQKGFNEAYQMHFEGGYLSSSQEKDLMHVQKNNTSSWMKAFLQDLKTYHDIDEQISYLGSGVGINFKLIKTSKHFQELKRKDLYEDYSKAKRRLILLDYEGTLPSITSTSEYASKGLVPNPKILSVLDCLTKDKRNTIFIVTGRETRLVSDWFKGLDHIGLAAEHGYFYRYSDKEDKWDKMLNDFNSDWRRMAIDQLEPYTDRCEGSFIEVKEASVVWQYRDCDPELGKSYAAVITLDIENTMSHLNINIINGKGYVEIKPKGINKGAFTSFIIKQEIIKGRTPDFILTIGDDTSDEEMFKYISKHKSALKKYSPQLMVYTVTVGKKPSAAMFYVDTANDVKNLLESFMNISIKKKISTSSMDLRYIIDSTREVSSSSNQSLHDKRASSKIIGELHEHDHDQFIFDDK